jgi:splicing factor 3A subunit 3
METILEQQRRSHEERERLVKTMVDENMMKKTSVKDQIYSDHRTKMMLDVSFFQLFFFLQPLT